VIGPGRKVVRRVMLESYKERPLEKQILEILDTPNAAPAPSR